MITEEEYLAIRKEVDEITAKEEHKKHYWEYPPEIQEKFRALGAYAANTPESREKAKQTRKKNKSLRDLTRFMLEADLRDEDEMKAALQERGFEASEQGAMVMALMNKAKVGDVEAFKVLRDTSGQKPNDALQVGNLNDEPIGINLANMSNEQLIAMINKRTEDPDE